MARKDNKGRNLKTGEYQRPDGRYEYRYKDEITGKRNSVYAADLASLREMEKQINKDMDDLLITDASVKKLTVNTLFERYMATKNIKERTKKNYIRMWDYRIRNTLGNIRVVDFKTSHVRTFFSSLSVASITKFSVLPTSSDFMVYDTLYESLSVFPGYSLALPGISCESSMVTTFLIPAVPVISTEKLSSVPG